MVLTWLDTMWGHFYVAIRAEVESGFAETAEGPKALLQPQP